MIVSDNIDAKASSFFSVLNGSVSILKSNASLDAQKYLKSGGIKFEELVLEALKDASSGTEFDGTIRLVSGLKFPDIVLEAGGVGVEVKSTTQNHWTTIGNSVLESTRIPDIEKIFLMFGKLAEPIDFKVRPYEDCLKEVIVTHYPRYEIDMELPAGQTIFDKLGKSYDEIRNLKEPVKPLAKYYSSQLKAGESLWWAGEQNIIDQGSPITVRELSSLSDEEKDAILANSFVLFPQLFGGRQDKFHDVLMWLLRKSLICGNIRDFYTAGGTWNYNDGSRIFGPLPQITKRLYKCRDKVFKILLSIDLNELQYAWKTKVLPSDDRFSLWYSLLSDNGCNEKCLMVIKNMFLR